MIANRMSIELIWSFAFLHQIQFYVSCCLSLALAQLCTTLLLLPPLLAPGHMLFCCCFVIPVLSYSLMGAELNDPAVMHLAMGKNQKKIMSKSVGISLIKLISIDRL